MSSKTYFKAAVWALALIVWGLAGPAALRAQDDAAKAMAAEHAHDQPAATAAATTPPSQPVTGENVAYGEFAGQKFNGYLAKPKAAGGKRPGLIVIHEWWGLNDNMRDM